MRRSPGLAAGHVTCKPAAPVRARLRHAALLVCSLALTAPEASAGRSPDRPSSRTGRQRTRVAGTKRIAPKKTRVLRPLRKTRRFSKQSRQRDIYRTPVPGRGRIGMTLREKFGSLYLAGFESASHRNKHKVRINELRATQHDQLVRQDYARLRKVGIRGVRESVNWDVVDKGNGQYDFTLFDRFIEAGDQYGMTQIWDIFHYGYPDGVDPFSDEFVDRFADYAGAVARHLKPHVKPGQPVFFTPVNEISWFAYAGGDIADSAPHQRGKGGALKRQLVRAWIAGANAIWKEIPQAQMVTAEPLVHRHPAPGAGPDEIARVNDFNKRVVREAYDMLAGRVAPELGGSPRHLGVVGANYYPHMNQSIDGGGALAEDDPRTVPFEDLLADLQSAYPDHQVMVTETMHDGKGRDRLIQNLTRVKKNLAARGMDDIVFTLYPIMRLHDWNQPDKWYPGGLYDHFKDSSRTVGGAPRRKRVIYKPMAEALRDSIRELDPENAR